MTLRFKHLLALISGVALFAGPSLAQTGTPPQAAHAAPKGTPDPGAELPTDPRLVTGTLENGVSYIVRPHSNPPGQMGVWMHLDTGSLNETDKQRGIAHFLEHMAFNGSTHFPPGEVVKYFESLGLTFGRDQNAFTSFDQTAYQLYLPDTKRETLDEALLFFSDVANHLDLDPQEIESERGIIFEELRTNLGPQQRVRDQWLSRLAPGSLIGERLPIGTEATLNTINRDDFVDYYNRWYVAPNITVIVAGDIDPKVAVEEITKSFGELPEAKKPEPQDANVTPGTERRAILAHDPELTGAQATLIVIDEPNGPETTQADLRSGIVDNLMLTAFNRRMQAKVSEGAVRFLSAGAVSTDLFKSLHLTQAAANGKPDAWQDMLTDVTTEVARVNAHGFKDAEFREAKAQLVGQLEQFAQQEPTFPVQAVLNQLNSQVATGDTIISPKQTLESVNAWLPEITIDEINERFAEKFDLSRATFLVTLPTSGSLPTEAQILEVGAAAADSNPEADAEAELADSLIEKAPTPGTVSEIGLHEASGVVSAWLSNGVRVHHRKMTQRENFVDVRITLAAGEIMESAQNRGISAAAAQAWRRPAAKGLTSANVRSLMAGEKASVSGDSGEDTFELVIQSTPDDLETGFQLAYRLLTDPVIEEAGFDQWKTETIQAIQAAEQSPQAMLGRTFQATAFPKDKAGAQPIEPSDIERITLAEAQTWLDAVVRGASIEVAVVGDIEQDEAFELVSTYIGSLPQRARISDTTLSRFRDATPPASDVSALVEIPTQTPAAGVLVGFYASDAKDTRDTQLLSMASRTLSTRMIETIREEDRLVYSIQASLAPGEPLPGFGIMFAGSFTDPARTGELVSRIDEIFTTFAETGPTEEEVATVKKQLAKSIEEAIEQPSFWAGQLGDLNYRGRKLDHIVGALDMYKSYTPADVQEAFARFRETRPKIEVVVTPKGTAAPTPPPPPSQP